MKLKGKAAIVTGASRGIGRAIAYKMALEGAKVLVNYHKSKDEAIELVKEIRDKGGYAVAFGADVRDRNSVREMVEVAKVNVGRPDIVVNNAGIARYTLFTDMPDEQWKEVMDTHVLGTYNVLKEVLPYMISEKKGCIINITSIWGICGAAMEVAYSTAKGAIIAMTKALAKELGPSGIRVNAIAPGIINTDMLSSFTAQELEKMRNAIPVKRIGTPEDVAEVAVYLASDEARYLTGQVITVDGGYI
jgi:short chain dehydrogenase.